AVAEQLPELLLLICNSMTSDQPDEVVRRISGERRFVEVRISGNEVLGPGVDVCKVASSASGYPNFLADRFVAFENQNRSSALSRFNRAHQAGSTSSNNHDVIEHTRIIYCNVDNSGRLPGRTRGLTRCPHPTQPSRNFV